MKNVRIFNNQLRFFDYPTIISEMSRKRSGTNVPIGPNPKNSKNLSRHIISQSEVPNEVRQEVPLRFSGNGFILN